MREVNIKSVSTHVVVIVRVIVSLTGVIITIYYQIVLLNYLYSCDCVKAFGTGQNGNKDNLVVWLNIDSKQKDESLNGHINMSRSTIQIVQLECGLAIQSSIAFV